MWLYMCIINNVTLMFVCHLFACLAKAALSALVVDDGMAQGLLVKIGPKGRSEIKL